MRPAIPLGLILPAALLLTAGDGLAQVTRIALPELSGDVGDTVSTDLTLEDAPGITGITLDIAFPSSLVAPDPNVVMGALGGSLQNLTLANVVGDTLKIAVAVIDSVGYVGSGVLLSIRWELLAQGLAPLEFSSVLLEDNNSPPPLPSNPVDGLIIIGDAGPPPPGSCECPPGQSRVTVSNVQGRQGDRVSVDVGVQFSPLPIGAFGFTLEYDPQVLSFVSGGCHGLTGDWATCDAVAGTPGSVTAGGFNTQAVPAGSTGAIARLTFDVICSDCVDGDERILDVTNLVDALEKMETCCGVFTYGAQCLSDGDVDANGSLTPGDGLCAFKMFFNDQTVTEDCDAGSGCEVAAADVDCNGNVTPGDALAIFNRWLEQGTPEHCFATGDGAAPPDRLVGAVQGRTEALRLDLSAAQERSAGVVAVPLVMQALEGAVAFGLELEFDPGTARFVRLETDAATSSWQGFEAREAAPGRVLVGGFDPWGLDLDALAGAGGEVTIGHLIFGGTALDVRAIEWHERRIGAADGDRRGAVAAPAAPLLGRPHPNPMHGSVAIALSLPAGAIRPLEVAVYDVQGRRVRTLVREARAGGLVQLEWDRRDGMGRTVGAGIYFFRLAVDDRIETRKFVVLN